MNSLLIISGISVLSFVTFALLTRRFLKADRSLTCRLKGRRYLARRFRSMLTSWRPSRAGRSGSPLSQGERAVFPKGSGPYRCRIAQTLIALTLLGATQAFAHPPEAAGEAGLRIPDLSQVQFLGVDGHKLLMVGIVFCVFGLLFGLVIYSRLKNLPVHRAMKDVSQLIWETCKTYLITQGKFLALLWVFIAAIIVLYFGVLAPVPNKPVATTLPIILLFSIVGICGSYGVAWFGIRVNTFANSRTAFASLGGLFERAGECWLARLAGGKQRTAAVRTHREVHDIRRRGQLAD